MIKGIEDFMSKPYQKKGDVPTIGYGTTVYPDGRKVTLRDEPITEQKASQYLELHCANVANDISKLVIKSFTQNQIDALICLVYNIGIGDFKESTLLKQLNDDQHNLILIRKQWLRWVYCNGEKLLGLEKRRMMEFLLYCK
jgi:lysozyme